MSIETIKFKNETASKGRNGIIKTSGVEVMSSSYGVMVSPITSKCKPSDACFIEVDSENIEDVILAMRKAVNPAYDEKEGAIKMLCEKYGLVRHLWHKTDIQDWATNRYRSLTDDELEMVAQSLARTDCEYGISWQTIDDTITNLINFEEADDDDSDPDEACERDREMHGTDGYENEDMDDDSDEFHYMRANYSEEPEQ